MINPFNSPVEIGLQTLVLLVKQFPKGLDMSRLVLYNHALLHSADLEGPESLSPPSPIRIGELGLKRQRIEASLRLLVRVGLVEMVTEKEGIEFVAADSAQSFLNLLESTHARRLQAQAEWVIANFDDIDDQAIRMQMRKVSSHWTEEFEVYEKEVR